MKPSLGIALWLSLVGAAFSWLSCTPGDITATGPYNLGYGDSILYLRNQADDYIVYPLEKRPGTYTGFPDGIEIDENSGAINVSKSETGLRYRITHTAPGGTQTSVTVVLSGINFTDKFYRLSQHDSIAFPVYNALESRLLPVAGSVFDEGGQANGSGCDVKTVNGQINLAQSVRNGLFGNTPSNDDRRDIDIIYRLNDQSGKAVNKIRVRLYYYTSMATVAPDLLQTLQDREELGVFLRSIPIISYPAAGIDHARLLREARPRPPCVIIIAN
ncbi:MAG TPA: hypothetical protein VFX58_05640 [Chitinophagaceae bacterium]|nr:hypothetical protein [Chitinophagaceae bacterium]